MPFADHRFIRSVLGATAVYLFWSAVAPPFGVLGPDSFLRAVFVLVAVLLLAVSLLHPLRPAGSAWAAPPAARTPTPMTRRWQSAVVRQPIAPSVGMRGRDTDALTPRGAPRSVIVLCDGTLAGDSACRLAERFATQGGAIVYAFALLPPDALTDTSDANDTITVGPIESFLNRVDAQLRRTTSAPAMWPLTLVVRDLEGELRRACASFGIDTIIVPAALCAASAGVLGAASAATSAAARSRCASAPVLCVVGAEGETSTPPAPASQRSDVRTLAPLASGEPIRSQS